MPRKPSTGADRSSSSMIDFRDVQFVFPDGTQVLEDLDFSADDGEFVTLVGRSGCGKSTLLNLLAGHLKPTAGDVWFQGRKLRGVNTSVGYMTQHDTLLPWNSVYKNVELPLKLRKVERSERAERVERFLDLVELGHASRMYPSQLSGGMRRRVLLARSLIYEPDVLLLDEPFAALDAEMREGLHDLLRATMEKLQQTVVFVTHDISEAIILADRVLVMRSNPGRVVRQFDMPFGAQRNLNSVRTDPRFSELAIDVRLALNEAIQGRVMS